MFENMIGKRSEKVLNAVEGGAVKKFAEAIGDAHPIYLDRGYAEGTTYGKNIAPPTFPTVFEYGKIEGLELQRAGLIHGEQQYRYERPLFVGEELRCWLEVEDYREKQGSVGKLGFLAIKSSGESPSGDPIFSSTQVIVITETVRKGMEP